LLKLWGITNLGLSKENGDRSKFLYGNAYRVGPPKKNNYRAYIGSVTKVGAVGKERVLVLLNIIQSSLSINEISDKIGSALIRKTHQ